MTEAEWPTWDSPYLMLDHIAGLQPDDLTNDDPTVWPPSRKARLFAVECCRRVEHLLTDERSRAAVDVVERYVDGRATGAELGEAVHAAARVTWEWDGVTDGRLQAASAACSAADDIRDHFTDAAEVASQAAEAAAAAAAHEEDGAFKATEEREEAHQAALVRDIFGNPFRPIELQPAWLTPDVLALAQGIYDERAFDRMPILADALQDAGCNNETVLDHCRDANAVHVRGCWVVGLLLGKS